MREKIYGTNKNKKYTGGSATTCHAQATHSPPPYESKRANDDAVARLRAGTHLPTLPPPQGTRTRIAAPPFTEIRYALDTFSFLYLP